MLGGVGFDNILICLAIAGEARPWVGGAEGLGWVGLGWIDIIRLMEGEKGAG